MVCPAFRENIFPLISLNSLTKILSPSTRKIDLGEKRQLYWQYRVPELYFIDPMNGQVVFDCLKDGGYETFTLQTGSFESRVLPGLVWDVAQLLNA